MTKAALLLPLALAAASAAAQTPPLTRVGVEAEHSSLTNGYDDWSGITLRLTRQWEPRKLAEAAVTQTRRFGLQDTQVTGLVSWPLSPSLTGTLTAHFSPTHRVLPEHGVGASLQWEFRKAWLLHGGLKHSRYEATPVDTASVMLEHYFGNWSVLAGVHASHALGERTQAGELRATWYYGDASSVGLIAAGGDEAIQLGGGVVAIAPVRSIALVGRHDLEGPWSLNWSAHRVRQGGFYTRSGAHVGVQYDF